MKGSHKGESRKTTNFSPLIFISLCSSIGVLNWMNGFNFSLLIVKVHLLIPNKSSSIRIMAHLKVIVTTFLAHSIHFKFSSLYAHLKKIFLDFLSTIKDNAGSDLESRSWYSSLNQASGIMLFRYGPPISWVMESNEQWQRDDYHWYGKWTLKWQERSNRNIRKCASARQRERHWRFHSLIIPHVSVLIRSKILTVCSRAWPLRTCPRRQWQFVLGFTLRNCKAKLIDEVCLWSREMWKEKN